MSDDDSTRTTPASSLDDQMFLTPMKSSAKAEEEPSTPLHYGLVDRNKKAYKLDYLGMFSGFSKEDFMKLQIPDHKTVTAMGPDTPHERSNSTISFSTDVYKSSRQYEVNFECYMDLCRVHYEIGM